MSRNVSFRLCIGLSVVAVFLFGFYSIRSHLALPAKTSALPGAAQESLRGAYDTFKSQSAESLGLLKDTLQKQAEIVQSASSTDTRARIDANGAD